MATMIEINVLFFYFHEVYKKESHIGLFTHAIRRYYNMVDFAGSFHEYDTVLNCVKPSPVPSYLNLIHAFDPHVWAGAAVRLVLLF